MNRRADPPIAPTRTAAADIESGVLFLLRHLGPHTAAQLAESLGVDGPEVRVALLYLGAIGRVCPMPGGLGWRIGTREATP